MSVFGLAGGQVGRRLIAYNVTVTPAMAPATVWTALGGWWRFPPNVTSILQKIHFMLPAGVGGTLRIRPVYRDTARGNTVIDLPAYAPGLNAFLTGDDIHLDLDLAERFTSRYELGVWAQHTGLLNHAFSVIYEVDIGGVIHG